MYFVYIVQCIDKFLYTGITGNLRKRMEQHNLERLTPFTKNRVPVTLVYWEKFKTRKEAARREKEIKGWRREKKEELIKAFKKSLH